MGLHYFALYFAQVRCRKAVGARTAKLSDIFAGQWVKLSDIFAGQEI